MSSQKMITAKGQVRDLVADIKELYLNKGAGPLVEVLDREILHHRVKFPIAEFIGEEIAKAVPAEQVLALLDQIIAVNLTPSYVIAGKVLWMRLPGKLEESFRKAVEYMIHGDEWYTCDILSERVFGNGILLDFANTLPRLEAFKSHPNQWLQRAPGVAVNLAVKRGVSEVQAEALMEMLLSQFPTRGFHVKKGAGWGVETIAKFHPELARKYEDRILHPSTNAWIRSKYKLGMNKAARRA